jgi:transposase
MPVTRPLVVRTRDQAVLEELARADRDSLGRALRAQIVLKAATGLSNKAIASELGISRATVIHWRQRYDGHGLPGLDDMPRPGRPRKVDESLVVAAALTQPLSGGYWSTRALGEAIGVSRSSVSNVLQRWNLHPNLPSAVALPTDPPMSPFARDIVGVYLNPPEYALAVSSSVSKTVPPLLSDLITDPAGAAVGHEIGEELIKSLVLTSKRIVEKCPPALLHEEFIDFLNGLVAGHGRMPLQLVVQNQSSLENVDTRRWLFRHPTVQVCTVPESPDWFDLATVLFCTALVSAKAPEPHGSSVRMMETIRSFVDGWHEESAHFNWNEPVISRLRRKSGQTLGQTR